MKRYGLTVVAALAGAMLCTALAGTDVEDFFSGTVQTPSDFSDAGDTGLSVSNAYICIPVATLTNATYTPALVTNDVRPFLAAVIDVVRTATNTWTTFEITIDTRYGSAGSTRTVSRTVSEQQTISVAPTYSED